MIERFRRIVEYRELLVGMTRKELKVKYKNSVLGFAWSLLNPLLYLVVFYVAFVKILGSGVPAFPIFLLSGLLVWNLFSTGARRRVLARSSANAGLVKKVAFPREILPLAAVGSMLVHFFLQSMVLFARARDRALGRRVGVRPAAPAGAGRAAAPHAARSASCSSAVNVYLRDTQHFLELALLAWFWVTPIVYGFMTIGGAQRLVRQDLHAESGHADRVDVPARDLRQARQPEGRCRRRATPKANQILPHWHAHRIPRRTSATRSWSAASCSSIAISVFGRSEANFAEEL